MSIGWPQTFGLDLDQVRSALATYEEEPNASVQRVSARLGIGGPKVESLNAWLKYLGLRDPKTRRLTDLGTLLHRVDPEIEDRGSLCMLHYLLVSNPDATIWFEAVNHFLATRSSFTRDDLMLYLQHANIGQHSQKHLRTDLGLFINTYTGTGRRALQALNFLSVKDNLIAAQPINDVNPLVLGFCLVHHLEHGPGESTTSIPRLLSEDGRPGRVFRLTENALREKLAVLESEGYISVIRIADIDGVSYTFSGSSTQLIQRYFGVAQ